MSYTQDEQGNYVKKPMGFGGLFKKKPTPPTPEPIPAPIPASIAQVNKPILAPDPEVELYDAINSLLKGVEAIMQNQSTIFEKIEEANNKIQYLLEQEEEEEVVKDEPIKTRLKPRKKTKR